MADGFDVLSTEHAEVRQLFERYSESKDEQLVREICDALTTHTQVEEQAAYPELRRLVDGGDDLADEAEQEHAAVKVLIERIEIAPPEDLSEVVDEMQQLVEKHVAEEEGTVFPEMREAGVDAEALGTRIAEARESVMARGSQA
jgi:hemerythrin superfamily protein